MCEFCKYGEEFDIEATEDLLRDKLVVEINDEQGSFKYSKKIEMPFYFGLAGIESGMFGLLFPEPEPDDTYFFPDTEQISRDGTKIYTDKQFLTKFNYCPMCGRKF